VTVTIIPVTPETLNQILLKGTIGPASRNDAPPFPIDIYNIRIINRFNWSSDRQ